MSETLAQRIAGQLRSLLPQGRIFGVDSSTTPLVLLLDGVAEELARARTRVDVLSSEQLPSESVELLPDWERALGLPDPDASPLTLEERQAAVAAKLRDILGHDAESLESIAASMGFAIVGYRRFRPFVAGSRAGRRLTNRYWSHVVEIVLAKPIVDTTQVAAALDRVRRAHARFRFAFADPVLIDGEYLLIDGEPLLLV